MKRLPKIMLVTAALVLIICALLLSGLRFFLPYINDYRTQIAARFEQTSGIPIEIGHLDAAWHSFGPSLTINQVVIRSDMLDADAEKISIELDVWRSLFSLRWRFRDLTFYQLNVDYKVPFDKDSPLDTDQQFGSFDDLFLRKFDNFTLKNSQISFLTPSEQKTTLLLPELSWLNQPGRHRAQGYVSLETINKQHGFLQVKLDLTDKNDILSDGTIYLQADNIDMQPWLSRWLRDNSGLQDANFSLSSWVTLKDSRIQSGLLQLRQGEANWEMDHAAHNLQVNDLLLRMRRQGNGWLFDIPELDTVKTDEYIWPMGSLSVLYLPSSSKYKHHDHWRIRAKNIQLERLSEILPTFSFLTPEMVQDWQHRQPMGLISSFAVDLTPDMPEHTQIDMDWHDVSWKKWKSLPSMNGFSGVLVGDKQRGVVSFSVADGEIDYQPMSDKPMSDKPMFAKPLNITKARGHIFWRVLEDNFELWSDKLDIQATSLWVNGQFRYQQQGQQKPDLNILAGIRLDDAGQAWRYFPQTLMGQDLTDYLTSAIIAGRVDEASLLFRGSPEDFPFYQNNGQFQVFVPLRDATFEYDPHWPAIFNLDIDLNFQRQGLFMSAPTLKLDKAIATDVHADIADYADSMLKINADIAGTGQQIHDYFMLSPMKESIGETLDILQIDGNVAGSLALSIPLEPEKQVVAEGTVKLNHNDIYIKSIDSQLKQVSGQFSFVNGNLTSNTLQGSWFGQPIDLSFTTHEKKKHYQVDIQLAGHWLAEKINAIPENLRQKLQGKIDWQGTVGITIPEHAGTKTALDIQLNSDISQLKHQFSDIDPQLLSKLKTLSAQAQGSTEQLAIYGDIGKLIGFNSEWQLGNQQVSLLKGQISPWKDTIPQLPKLSLLQIDLPEISDPKWLMLLGQLDIDTPASKAGDMRFDYPHTIKFTTPSITFGGQQWKQLALTVDQTASGFSLQANSPDIRASLNMPHDKYWQLAIDYLYFNPLSTLTPTSDKTVNSASQIYHFASWPTLNVLCRECWISGYKLGQITATLQPKGHTLQLTGGTLNNSATQLTLDAIWQSGSENKTQLAGTLQGERFDDTAAYYGVLVPIIESPYVIEFDVNWRDTPWSPDVSSLNGLLTAKLGKGAISEMGGGNAGRLLRLMSFDALLRKLRFDFRDTFSNDFNFDSIKATAKLTKGVLSTENTLIDGLIADIKLSGQINLLQRKINMEVVVTPELSATVGVATAFAVNPIVGAAVFAASKVFGPLWSKISVIRYHITGSLDEPKIDEVLRQLKENEK
ncbi:AsmA2 domain-containing protein YhdP [Moellerella wisconsensis]|uniref:AsmA2 domain-containing protein YhdP n=1 Tax=Moellerella wisconsensis TaxID=158849 RepID=UPI0030762F79